MREAAMSPEQHAEALLGIDVWPDRQPDLADAIGAFAKEMDLEPSQVASQIAECLLKTIEAARLRRLTKAYIEE
jgi:hypothetical protein